MGEERTVPQVVVVGFGRWGRNHVRNYHALGALAAICEPDADARAAAAEAYPEVPVLESLEPALDDAEVQGVVLATPAETHAPLARQAMVAGKDVLSEKPLALDPEDARGLVALARAEERVLMVGHLLEYHPAVQEIARRVEAGELGQLRTIICNRLNLGTIRSEENVLWSFAPHDVAFLLRLTGERPSAVSAFGTSWLQPGIEDTVAVHLQFPSGVEGHILASWLHPFKEQRLVVVGERAMLSFEDRPQGHLLQLWPHRIDDQSGRPVAVRAEPETIEVPAAEPLRRECEAFLEAIRTRKQPLADGASGLRVLEVLARCQADLKARAVSRSEGESTGWFAHETATVDPGAAIGDGTRIWHHSHVMASAQLGAGCVLGQNVFVAGGVRVGQGCKIQNNVSLFEGVTLGDEVFCGPSAVFTNVRTPRAHVERKNEFARTRVGRRATIGANATVVCGLTLGVACFVAAGAVVTHDVPAYALVQGSPARVAGWMCACGERLALAVDGDPEETASCERCGASYRRQYDGAVAPA